jgi:Asp-tRNA(Asn)/Glu-tRNA(Gln) amidotransferase C subunit
MNNNQVQRLIKLFQIESSKIDSQKFTRCLTKIMRSSSSQQEVKTTSSPNGDIISISIPSFAKRDSITIKISYLDGKLAVVTILRRPFRETVNQSVAFMYSTNGIMSHSLFPGMMLDLDPENVAMALELLFN